MPGTTLPSAGIESVRYSENIKEYPLGRYIDPNDSRVMHEGHPIYRVELRPELFARITEVLVFNRLSSETQLEIGALRLDAELSALSAKGYSLTPDKSVLPFLVLKGFHPRLGARPMRGAVEKYVRDALASDLLTGGDGRGELSFDPLLNALTLRGNAVLSS